VIVADSESRGVHVSHISTTGAIDINGGSEARQRMTGERRHVSVWDVAAPVENALMPSSTEYAHGHEIQDRLLGLALAALLATIGGELIGSQLVTTVGVTVFALSLVTLFAVMTVVLVVNVARPSSLDALDPTLTERPR